MSKAAGGSSLNSSSTRTEREVFTMADTASVIALLRRVHTMAISAEAKNDLRDAVFALQTSSEITNQAAAKELFESYGIALSFEKTPTAPYEPPTPPATKKEEAATTKAAPENPSQTASAANRPAFGRPAPQFGRPAAAASSVPAPAADEIKVGKVKQGQIPDQTSPKAKDTSHEITTELTHELPTEQAEPAQQKENSSATEEDSQTESAPPATATAEQVDESETNSIPITKLPEVPVTDAQELSGEEAKEPTTTEVPPSQPQVPQASNSKASGEAATDDPSERIKAIKKEVNAMVGNPVNLIDVNNDVGREYMNALLDAMKKVNSGVAATDMERAMGRLETAFTAVKQTVAASPTSETNGSSKPAEAPDPAPAATEPVATAPTAVPDASSEIDTTSTTVAEPPVPPPTEAEPPGPTPAKVTSELSDEVQPPTEPGEVAPPPPSQPQPPVPPAPPSGEPKSTLSSVAAVSKESVTGEEQAAATAPATAEGSASAANTGFTAVAQEKRLEQMLHEKEDAAKQNEAALAAEISKDPLMAQDVDMGLEQLLSEWKLFKSSGIFGTGPSGVDHPLYKKLAPLTMAAVLSGRFDGGTSEVKQNITEYMSGWRYEEGITYEPGESFEHYLRRVIRHILDRQKKAVDKAA